MLMSNFQKLVISYKSKQGEISDDFKITLEGTPTLSQLLDVFESVLYKCGMSETLTVTSPRTEVSIPGYQPEAEDPNVAFLPDLE